MRIVAVGADTLHGTAPLSVPEDVQHFLEQKRLEAAGGAEVVIPLGSAAFKMSKSPAGGYRWKLEEGDGGLVLLLGRNQGGEVKKGVKIEVTSYGCWRGLRESLDVAREALHFICRVGRAFEIRCTRLDLCVDFQLETRDTPITPELAVGVVMRGRKEAANGGTDGLVLLRERSYRKCRTFEGWDFGKGKPVMVRLYDKTREIAQQSPDKAWFHTTIWPRAGLCLRCPWLGTQFRDDCSSCAGALSRNYDPSAFVETEAGFKRNDEAPATATTWRLEVECKSELLRLVRVGGLRLHTVEEVLANAETIFRYFVGHHRRQCRDCGAYPTSPRARRCSACGGDDVKRSRGWVEMRIRPESGDQRHTERWPLQPLWKQLQEVPFSFSQPATPDVRRVKEAVLREIAKRQALGNLSSFACASGLRREIADLKLTPDESAKLLLERTIALLREEFEPRAFLAALEVKDKRRRPLDHPFDARELIPPARARAHHDRQQHDAEMRDARKPRLARDQAARIARGIKWKNRGDPTDGE